MYLEHNRSNALNRAGSNVVARIYYTNNGRWKKIKYKTQRTKCVVVRKKTDGSRLALMCVCVCIMIKVVLNNWSVNDNNVRYIILDIDVRKLSKVYVL